MEIGAKMAKGSIRKAIPSGVLAAIQEHIRRSSEKGESGWRNAPSSEDTLTGHLGASMQIGWSEPSEDSGYFWRWRVEYRKFSGGNQNSSEEKPTGSDGIIQIEIDRFKVEVSPSSPSTVSLENLELESTFRKGLLFQAKRLDSTERERLVRQLEVMERVAPVGGCYFEYGPRVYRAATAKNVIEVDGFTKNLGDEYFKRLGDFLCDDFLECKSGVEGLWVKFDSTPHELHFPESTEEVNKLRDQMGHGLRVLVTGFRMVPFNRI